MNVWTDTRFELKNRILAALVIGDATVAGLAELLAEKKSKIRRVLNALQNERKVVRMGFAGWHGARSAAVWSCRQAELELERDRETKLRAAVRETEPNLRQLEKERYR
jgi:hypothetical protein